MSDPHKHKSKFLSLVLRHEPERVGIRLDESGWVAVDELLEGCRRAGNRMSLDELKEIVRTNNKQRFAFSDDGTRIRANQGHSVEVELGYEPAAPPEVLYHGTAEKHLPGIRREGLIKGRDTTCTCRSASRRRRRWGNATGGSCCWKSARARCTGTGCCSSRRPTPCG